MVQGLHAFYIRIVYSFGKEILFTNQVHCKFLFIDCNMICF